MRSSQISIFGGSFHWASEKNPQNHQFLAGRLGLWVWVLEQLTPAAMASPWTWILATTLLALAQGSLLAGTCSIPDDNREFANCEQLPSLGALYAWTYNNATNTVDFAFQGKPPRRIQYQAHHNFLASSES